MKLSLTYEFSSVEELNAHLAGASVPAKKTVSGKKTKDAEDVAVPTPPVSQAAEVFPTPPAQPASPIPAAKPTFDRNLFLAHVSSTANELKAAGYPETKIPTIFVNIFTNKLKVPGKKLGELDDTTLANFSQHFDAEVENFKTAFGGAVAPTSFI